MTTAPETLADGFAVLVDDGSGALRVVVGAASGISRDALRRGSTVGLTGVLGQHASSGGDGRLPALPAQRVGHRGGGTVAHACAVGLRSCPQRVE